MASRFARFSSSRARLFLGVSASSLGVYYASTHRKIYADMHVSGPQQGLRESFVYRPQAGVHRVDSVSWPSNYPCEDVITSMYVRPMSWSFWSVYDGHVGPQTAWHLEKHLLPNLAESLYDLYAQGALQPQTDAIHKVIKDVFVSLDDDIVKSSAQIVLNQPEGTPIKALAARVLHIARAGSCALVAFYDHNVRTLHVPVVGDSRAILGRRRKDKTSDGKVIYDVHVLSLDQTGNNPAEVERLTALHPDEKDKLFKGPRFLGWGVSRAFGNGVMKWSVEVQKFMQEKCLGHKPRDVMLTPPYFTAEPEITSTKIESGDFMIMASDGLWDCLTNEEAVGLVGAWLERNGAGSSANAISSFFDDEEEQVIERGDLPVQLPDDGKTHYANWPGCKKQFVNVDSNVARHLARNALGGADKDLHVALMSTPAPRSRYFRDDVSAVVVFFE
ncbi:PPM-type phosphatase domain-containing protein [Favolaschia claudopus]|uniref:PPM-type phosphatase domain-containing protein n=1 Tax=Favolaschia claudopus TaxID=2862362 RepID=A0AAW0CBJ9_9AGAR